MDLTGLVFLSAIEKHKTLRRVGQEWGYKNPAVSLGQNKEQIAARVTAGVLDIVFTEPRTFKGSASNIQYYKTNFSGWFKLLSSIKGIEQFDMWREYSSEQKTWISLWDDDAIRKTMFKTDAIIKFTGDRDTALKNCWIIPLGITELFLHQFVLKDLFKKNIFNLPPISNDQINPAISLGGLLSPGLSPSRLYSSFLPAEYDQMMNCFKDHKLSKTKAYASKEKFIKVVWKNQIDQQIKSLKELSSGLA